MIPAIVQLLSNAASATVGDRIHAASEVYQLPLPKLTFQQIDRQDVYSNSGPTGTPTARVQVNCLAATYPAAKALAKLVRDYLSGYRGTIGGSTIDGIFLDDEGDLPIAPQAGVEKPAQHVRLDFRVNFQE